VPIDATLGPICPRMLTRLLFADEAADYNAILEVCDATETSTSSETSAMMDEMGRLGAMWEESWHATLADLQVCKCLGGCTTDYMQTSACLGLQCKVQMQP